MKKILFIVLGDNLNGTERYVLDIIRYLPTDIFDAYFGIPYDSRLNLILQSHNVKTFNFRNDTLKKFRFKGIINIARFIIKNKIDIIHSNSGIIPCIIGKLLGASRCYETRHGIFYTDKQLASFTLMQKYHEKIKQYFVDFQIVISENDKERLMKCFEISEEKIKVIYNGIDIESVTEKGRRTENGIIIPEEKFKFLNIGRLTYQKGQNVLIEAANLLQKERQNFTLTITGEGEDHSQLQSLIDKYKLNNIVKIESYMEDIYEFIKEHDALVMTSRYEGVPYVVLESMALGVPVIHTDVGGISNILTDRLDGMIAKQEDAIDFMKKMLELLNDFNLYKSLRDNAFKTIQSYTIEKMVSQYVSLYLNENTYE